MENNKNCDFCDTEAFRLGEAAGVFKKCENCHKVVKRIQIELRLIISHK